MSDSQPTSKEIVATVFAWLIEKIGSEMYFCPGYLDEKFLWLTADPNEAVRFARKEDAERVMEHLNKYNTTFFSDRSKFAAVEHGWMPREDFSWYEGKPNKEVIADIVRLKREGKLGTDPWQRCPRKVCDENRKCMAVAKCGAAQANEPLPRYQCIVAGCHANHVSKWDVCPTLEPCALPSALDERPASKELTRLRKAQANAVMPLIGPLLEAFEQVPNDVLGMVELSDLCVAIEAINSAIEDAE